MSTGEQNNESDPDTDQNVIRDEQLENDDDNFGNNNHDDDIDIDFESDNVDDGLTDQSDDRQTAFNHFLSENGNYDIWNSLLDIDALLILTKPTVLPFLLGCQCSMGCGGSKWKNDFEKWGDIVCLLLPVACKYILSRMMERRFEKF